jgi:hypothetical protein
MIFLRIQFSVSQSIYSSIFLKKQVENLAEACVRAKSKSGKRRGGSGQLPASKQVQNSPVLFIVRKTVPVPDTGKSGFF